jgi:uncharacterized MAPEG superfamily protein
MATMGYAELSTPLSDWAVRAKKAHYNAVENLVLFGPLVLAYYWFAGGNTGAEAHQGVAMAAMVYFLARMLHFLVYIAAVPLARTAMFLVGFGAQVYVGVVLLRLVTA